MTFESKFRNFIGRLKQKEFSRDELLIMGDELLRLYNEERKIVINGWQGKSSFSFKQVGDKIIITKYQRPEKGAEPKEIKTEIEINELRKLTQIIMWVFKINKERKYIKSRELGEKFYNLDWDTEIFCNRKLHNRFTIALNVLEKKEIIEYRGGRIYLK